MEVKKVKRDSDSLSSGDSGQNGAVSVARPRGSSGSDRSTPNPSMPGPLAPHTAPTPQLSALDACSTDSPAAPFPLSGLPELGLSNQGLESVESLIEELLEQAPDDPSPLGDSNGQGISIEAFTQELSELEDRVREKRGARLEDSPREPLSALGRPDEEPPPPSPLDGDLSGAEARVESSVVGVFSPAKPLGQAASQPYTGPFMAVLFAKLENMLQNSLYVNILLTGILSQLACYPQPLLRSFLLNTNMVFQPSVKSLLQVLGSVKNRIEAFAASHEDFPSMLRKAQRYLAARGKLDWADSPAGVPPLRRSDSLVKSRKPSLGDLILRHTNSPTRARHAAQLALAHVRDGGQSLHSVLFKGGASGLEKQAEALRVKNAVYCAVIFSEFLKELAALALEHAVTVPFPRSQEAEE